MPITKNNQLTKSRVEIGRYLFYDSILSSDKKLSCSSCHKQENAFSDNIKYSRGFNGQEQRRNTPALYNLAWHSSFFWDGRMSTLEELVFEPVRTHNEMNLSWTAVEKRIQDSKFYRTKFKEIDSKLKIDSTEIANCIAQFLKTLVSCESKYDRVIRGEEFFSKDEYKGFVIFNDQSMGNCHHCHSTDGHALASNFQLVNNGLELNNDFGYFELSGKDKDKGKFKVPSLRNLSFSSPYMHDGRFKNLEEVLEFYLHGVNKNSNLDHRMDLFESGQVKLNETEKKQLIQFLYTLNDSVYVKNEMFSNPFKN